MNQLKRYKLLIFGVGGCLLLTLVTAFLLIRGIGSYGEVQDQLQSKGSELQRLEQSKPYPSADNVKALKTELAGLKEQRTVFEELLLREQIKPMDIQAGHFNNNARSIVQSLKALAKNTQVSQVTRKEGEDGEKVPVKLPVGFGFSFEKYIKEGTPPKDSEVERLTIQLQQIKALALILLNGKVTEIVKVSREAFDGAGAAAVQPGFGMFGERGGFEMGGPGGMPGMEFDAPSDGARAEEDAGKELYSRETYQIVFRSTEKAAWDVVKALTASKMIVVIRSLELKNENTLGGGAGGPAGDLPMMGGAPPGGNMQDQLARLMAGAGAGAPGEGEAPNELEAAFNDQKRELIAGNELVQLTLQIDVYRFHVAAESSDETPEEAL